jgi:hypothetical protein
MSICPACSQEGVAPHGNKQSPWLLVFSVPYSKTESNGWRDRQLTGLDVLSKEFGKVGLSLRDFRIATLWLHDDNGNENCYNAGRQIVLDEAKGKQVVVLVGSEVIEEFCGKKASDVYGLQVDSHLLSAPIVFVLPKLESVFVRGAGIGEVRLSIQKLGRILNNVQ